MMQQMQEQMQQMQQQQQQAQPTRPQGYVPASWLEGAWTWPGDCFTMTYATVHAPSEDEIQMSVSGGACPCLMPTGATPFYRDESIGVVNVFHNGGKPLVRIKVDENKMEKGPQTEYPMFMNGPATKTSPTNHKASQSTSTVPQPQTMANRA